MGTCSGVFTYLATVAVTDELVSLFELKMKRQYFIKVQRLPLRHI